MSDKTLVTAENLSKTIKYLKTLQENEYAEVCIMQDDALNLDFLKVLCDAHSKICFNVMYDENDNRAIASWGQLKNWNNRGVDMNTQDYLMFSSQETKSFIENYNYIKTNYQAEMIINDEFTVEMAVNATNKVNDWVDDIKNAKVNGEPLSDFEKYLMAYQIVSRYTYKIYENDDGFSRISRDLVSVLNSDYIVCSGYAKLLSEICKKLGINCDCQMMEDHQVCTVDITDPKYNISGRFLSDPTRGRYIDNKYDGLVDLYKSCMFYPEDFYPINRNAVIDRQNYSVDYKAEDVLGETFDSYKKKVKQDLFDDIERILKPIKNRLMHEDKGDSKSKIESDIELYLNNYGLNKEPYFERLIWVWQYSNLSLDQIKQLASECLEEIDFNDPYVLTNVKEKYFENRRKNAQLPSVQSFITAFERTLIAQGINNQSDRNKIIRETLKISALRADEKSYFFKGKKLKSLAQKEFDNMTGGFFSFLK